LVILPKWATLPDPARRGWVHVLGPGLGRATSRFVGKSATVDLARADDDRPRMVRGVDLLTAVTALVPSLPQVVNGDNVTPLLALPDGGALIARVGDGQLYVAADPDLFDNHGLKDPRTARAALAIIDALNETGTRRIDFDLTMNGFGTAARKEHPSMLRTALEPPFLAMTLALLVAALLAGLHGAFRFGPIRRPIRALAFGKAALVENSAGLIRLARREATLGPAYVEVLRQEAARAAYLPPTVQGDQLDAHLDRLTRHGDSFSTHALRLSHAYDRAGLVAAARALFQWKKDNIR
jgi:hypothetical protein